MKRIILIFAFLSNFVYSQKIEQVSGKTAFIIPAKSYEIGIFQPLKIGIAHEYEISTHPIAFFVSPNLQVKRYLKEWRRFCISTQHTIYYPTPLLKMIAREGTGGIIAHEFKDDIPHMFSLYNGLLISKKLNSKQIITLKGGVKFAINSGDLDSRTTIDLPLVYPRLQVFYEGFGFQYGGTITARMYKHFYSDTNFEIFHFPGSEENLSVEFSTMYSWMKDSKIKVSAGYKFIYGQYPFGSQWHMLPMFDINWKFFR